jgi:predicted Zn-dependent peptidase
MIAAAFTRHRLRRWRIGSNEVLRSIRRENLLRFFETLHRPERELTLAKAGLLGRAKLDLQTNAAAAADLLRGAILGGDPEYTRRYRPRLEAVTASGVQRVAQRYLGTAGAIGILRGGG